MAEILSLVQRCTSPGEGHNESNAYLIPHKRRKAKMYVPGYRTGAYALLLALYGIYGEDERLNKEELIERAQPLCDISLTVPTDPKGLFTGWNSMKTLQNHDYVYCNGNPKRYTLTDAGMEVAQSMAANAANCGPSNYARNNSPPREWAADVSSSRGNLVAKAMNQLLTLPNKGHQLVGRCEEDKKDDDNRNSDELSDPNWKARLHVIDERRRWLVEQFLDEPQSRSEERYAELIAAHEGQRCRKVLYATSPNKNERHVVLSLPPLQSLAKPIVAGPPLLSATSGQKPPRTLQPTSTDPPLRQISHSICNPSIIQADCFTIHLILDTREVRMKTDREYLRNQLAEKGVIPIMRALSLGDFMWVARENVGENREVVLDYIMERKRLDDLANSIRDGRFQEQKLRLMKSGIGNVIYLIEEYNLGDTAANRKGVIETAISSTQVVNDFFLKRTKSLDETIRYVVRLTRNLEQSYKHKDLYVFPRQATDPKTFPNIPADLRMQDSRFWSLETTTFSCLVSKNGNTMLQDVFLKMLMCQRGISLEKAIELQQLYGVPIKFLQAYERCINGRERKNMVKNALDAEVGRRKIGSSSSEKLAEVWGTVDGF